MSTMVGFLPYVPREVLAGSYKMSCDLWSLGVITYSLLTGAFPFESESLNGFNIIRYKKIVFSPFFKTKTTSRCRCFVRKLLRRNEKRRLNCL